MEFSISVRTQASQAEIWKENKRRCTISSGSRQRLEIFPHFFFQQPTNRTDHPTIQPTKAAIIQFRTKFAQSHTFFLTEHDCPNSHLFCQLQARLKPKRCLGGFIFALNKNNNKTTFVSYFNSPRKGCPRGMKIKDDLKKNKKWKVTSKK